MTLEEIEQIQKDVDLIDSFVRQMLIDLRLPFKVDSVPTNFEQDQPPVWSCKVLGRPINFAFFPNYVEIIGKNRDKVCLAEPNSLSKITDAVLTNIHEVWRPPNNSLG